MFNNRLPLTASLIFLSACSYTSSHSIINMVEPAVAADDFNLHDSIVQDDSPKPVSPLLDGNTLASSHDTCIDYLNFLRAENPPQYQKYAADYGRVTEGYEFLNRNKNIMAEDAKEMYTLNLRVKLDTLCSQVQYSGHQLVKYKIQNLIGR
ncbi:MAG: hypothetical protein ACRCWW_09340 [Scandinavium sp.]|uniref:hypothetical protein n=1 Tax=Scandinavium sp. TaxID=2830653 RepID=UPI003F396D9D